MSSELKADLDNPVPDVGEKIIHRGKNERVRGWWHLIKMDSLIDSDDEADHILHKIMMEDYANTYTRYKLVHCLRDEATVLGLGGSFARVDEIERTGEYYELAKSILDMERDSAINRANSPDKVIDGIGGSYLSTLQRLFPDIVFLVKDELELKA